MPSNAPVDVQTHGQSIWYDNIQRGLLENGDFKRLIDDYGIMGVTSNPSIFHKAIGESSDYDAGILRLLDLEPHQIYERLAIEDIQRAADLLRPIYDRTDGADGYVSLEVSPLIADDTATTVAEARRLFAAVGRPNTMIKIPATAAGIPAIEEAIASGVNVNVTLIFSIKNYLAVAEAYIRGLERRLEAGENVDHIASVASFFVSRIDTVIDRMLENNIRSAQGRDINRVSANRQLLGKAAIANARLAYKRFGDVFYGQRFARLREAGARVQRPLWASTGTKNPAYPDTMYIDNLVAKDTVNTVPPTTLIAYADHGSAEPMPLNRVGEAGETLDRLAEVGVDIDHVTNQLQLDGVEAFAEAFRNLMAQVDAKRDVLRTGIIRRQEVVLGIYAAAVQTALKDLESSYVNMRLWEKDGSVWKNHNPTIQAIRNRLGWLDVRDTIDLERLRQLQADAAQWSHVVVLGMGGSSLAPEVLAATFGPRSGFPVLRVLDSTNPASIRALEAAITLEKTLFVVSSKSGTTVETRAFFNYFYERTGRNGAQFLAITDPGTPLADLAAERQFRDVFLNPGDIGGRYSALSYFGLVPAALMGVDLDALWASAGRMMTACGPNVMGVDHAGLWLGTIMGVLAQQGRDKISIITSPSIAHFGNWIEQLLAESTGKEGCGLIPVVGATIGSPHDYVSDRLFIYLRVDDDDNEDIDQGVVALQQASQPCVTLRLPDTYALGGEFFRWMYATAVAGHLLDVNPFDEPNVTESKTNTSLLLAHYEENGRLPEPPVALQNDLLRLYADDKTIRLLSELSLQQQYESDDLSGLVSAQINSTSAGDYFTLLAYLPSQANYAEALEHIRRRLRHTTRRATVIGYGPRYLHSTGQLHKGGPSKGVFFIITREDADDIDIPDLPYSFGTLHRAQAIGDMEALQYHGQRVVRLHLTGDVVAGLQTMLYAIELVDERRQ